MGSRGNMEKSPQPGSQSSRDRPRRVPTQRRSRARVERVLSVATALITEKGIDGVTTSEIADRARVSIGSLYQYFPDKAAIVRTLADRYNAKGRACVAAELAAVGSESALLAALHRIVDGYYRMFLREPVMRDIWRATQADKALQELDAADCEAHAALLTAVLTDLRPDHDPAALATLSSLLMQLIAAAVRHAITLERRQGEAAIEMFKGLLSSRLTGLLERTARR